MKRKRISTLAGAAGGLLLLILDGRTALEGANQGIELCLRTVIPSLFPFFLLSMLLTSSLLGSSIPVLKPLTHLLRIPEGTESVLLTGFLGGYPVGAQSIAAAYQSGQLKRTDAQRMLSFCNNAGPAFLFGMIGSMFPSKWMVWLLWLIHILSALLVALIMPGSASGTVNKTVQKPLTLPAAMRASMGVMAAVCGWVVLFRVIIAFLDRWILWLLPVWAQVAVSGILELTNGCCSLAFVPNLGQRFILCSGMLAFGGICVTMQTMSVVGGLGLKHYLTGKLLQTVLSVFLACAVTIRLPAADRCPGTIAILSAAFCFAAIFTLIMRNLQKRDSISASAVV